MNIQEAYNKGLDDAEALIISKLSNAIVGKDDGPFNNPSMEELRNKILNNENNESNTDYILDILLNREVDMDSLLPSEQSIASMLVFCKSITTPRPTSKIAVKIKEFLTSMEVDLINNRDKLS